jgi:hypothetical protein
LGFGVWNLIIIWKLVFGAWYLPFDPAQGGEPVEPSFDVAQDGELVEPFDIWDLLFVIYLVFGIDDQPVGQFGVAGKRLTNPYKIGYYRVLNLQQKAQRENITINITGRADASL